MSNVNLQQASAAGCCAVEEQAAWCTADEKSDCCGAEATASGGCGCK